MPDLTLNSQLEHARSLVERGELLASVEVCRNILSTLPRCIEPYAILASAALAAGKIATAAGLFARVLGSDPQHVEAARGMSAALLRAGDAGGAAAWARRASESALRAGRSLADDVGASAQDPPEREALSLSVAALACMQLRSGMYASAVREFRRALEATPVRDDLAVGLAEAAYGAGQESVALDVSEGILLRLPFCLKALLIRGRVGLGSPDDTLARELLARAQSLDPENRVAQYLFGDESPLPPRAVRVPMPVQEPVGLLVAGDELDWDDDDEGTAPPTLRGIL
ncbi:MAG: tetratricopeptide repeat protein [Anaerolineae bacterium]|nr:tetratricopeptide repeat protein [Chloroflexota bacterium]